MSFGRLLAFAATLGGFSLWLVASAPTDTVAATGYGIVLGVFLFLLGHRVGEKEAVEERDEKRS